VAALSVDDEPTTAKLITKHKSAAPRFFGRDVLPLVSGFCLLGRLAVVQVPERVRGCADRADPRGP